LIKKAHLPKAGRQALFHYTKIRTN
jgi:hypothetical protein